MQGLAESLFPRSSKLAGLNQFHPRALLGAGLDVASLPGRAYASLGRMDDETYMQALGRTSPRYVVGQGEGDEMADAILRDPLTPIGVGLGSLLRGARPFVGLASDLGTNAAGMAADQYSSAGMVNPGEISAGAGMGVLLGLGGMAKSGKRYMISQEERAKNLQNWFAGNGNAYPEANPLSSDLGKTPKRLYTGTTASYDIPDANRTGSNFGVDKTGVRGYFYATESPEYAARYADPEDMASSYGTRNEKGELVSSSNIMPVYYRADKLFNHEDAGDIFRAKKALKLTKAETDRLSGGDYRILESEKFQKYLHDNKFDGFTANEHGVKNYAVFEPTQIKSATGNRGTFDPSDPNITHFAGSSSVPSRNRATTRLERQALQIAYDKYGQPREESAGGRVSAFQGLGNLLFSPSDTYFTKGAR